MQQSPFKFLDSYSKEDREIFFGRDKEIEELHSGVFESKILVVYGISGTGKSSLINCGLANKFHDTDWLPVNVRRGLNINQSLFTALAKSAIIDSATDGPAVRGNKPNDLLRLIRSVYLDHFKPVFLIFDQFEELFIFGSKDEKEEFIKGIRRVIDSDLQCRFIFSIREEYLAGFTEFEKVIPSFLSNRIRIEKMTRLNALQVIEGPCKIRGIEVDPGFPAALLDQLGADNPDVELTYLQVYLDKVFRLASQDGKSVKKFSAGLLDKVGDVKDLLGAFLEEQISRLDDPETGTVILKSFVSAKGTRQQITEEDVIDYSRTFGKGVGKEEVKNLIRKFIGLRILREKDEYGRYELRHDSLATRIYEKITLVEKELLEIRQFIENSYNNFEKRQLYLTADDLKYIAPYEAKLFLNEKILRFIVQSKRATHRAKRRRQNVLLSAAVIIFSVLSFFTVWALRERNTAMDQTLIAEEQKNSALQAKEIADSARTEALKSKNMAVEKENMAVIAQKQSDAARKEALTEREYALNQQNRAEQLSVKANEQAQLANQEKLTAEQERSKAVVAEAKATQLSLLSTAQNLALKSLSLSQNPQLMGLLAVQAYYFNKNNGGKPEDPIIFEALHTAWSSLDNSVHSLFSGSPDEIHALAWKDNELMTADLDGIIRKWSNDGTSEIISKLSVSSPVSFLSSSPDGRYIITQHDNMNIFLWDLGRIDNGGPAYIGLKGHKGNLTASAFSSTGDLLATGGNDSLIFIWDLKSTPAAKIKTITAPSQVKALVFGDSGYIISAQADGSVTEWSLNTAGYTTLLKKSAEIPLCLAWNDNKKILLAGCPDGSILFLKMNKVGVQDPVSYPVHNSGIDLMTFDHDFSHLATAGRDKSVRLYSWEEFFGSGNAVGGQVKMANVNSRIRSLIFTGDNRLVAGMADQSIRIWETSADRLSMMILGLVRRDMTSTEWDEMVGKEIPYEATYNSNR